MLARWLAHDNFTFTARLGARPSKSLMDEIARAALEQNKHFLYFNGNLTHPHPDHSLSPGIAQGWQSVKSLFLVLPTLKICLFLKLILPKSISVISVSVFLYQKKAYRLLAFGLVRHCPDPPWEHPYLQVLSSFKTQITIGPFDHVVHNVNALK